MVRGGSWNNNRINCRCAYRNNIAPGNRNNDIGFRVCVSPHIDPTLHAPRCHARPGGAVVNRLAQLRLVAHESSMQVLPTRIGIPWLGFVIYPGHRRVKSRQVVHGTRRLAARLADYHGGRISFAEFDAVVQGWVNHVRYADSWGLRRHVLGGLSLRR